MAREAAPLDARALVAQLAWPAALLEGEEHVFTAVSESYRRIAGGGDLLGRPFREALPGAVEQGFADLLDQVFATGEPAAGTDVTVSWDEDGDGVAEDHVFDFVYQPVFDAQSRVRGVVAQVAEKTEPVRLERERAFLAEASEVLASSLDYDTTLSAVTELAVQGIADWCAVDELRPDGSVRRIAVAHPDPEKVELAHALQEKYPPDPEAPHGVPHVLRTGEPELVPEIPDELLVAAARDEEHLRLARALGLRSYIAVPLVARGAVLGALSLVASESGRRFDERDFRLAQELARRAALAIDNARLYRDTEEARQELEEQATELEAQAEELQQQAWQLEETQAELEIANDALRDSRARLQATIDSSLDAVVSTDRDSVILEWNAPAETIFGWSAEEAIGRTLAETIIPPRHREAHQRGVERYLRTGEGRILNQRIEITALRRDGREFPVELTVAHAGLGEQVVFNAFIRDLTERTQLERQRAAEHALTRVLAESRTLAEAAPRVLQTVGEPLGWDVGVFWVVDRAADVLRAEAVWHAPSVPVPAFEAATRHRTFGRGVGLPGGVWERRRPAWIANVARDENFPRASAAGGDGLHGAFAFPVVAGEEEEVLGVIEFFHHEIREPDGALLQSVAVIGNDIAQAVQRVQAEEERDRALAEVERINQHLQQVNAALEERTAEAETANRAKSNFLANMSHELRTPINAVLGYADLLEMGVTGPVTENQRHQLERIRVSSQHLMGLIEDILDLSKIEADRITVAREPVRIGDPVEAALALVEPQAAEKGLHLTNPCRGDTSQVALGDEDRVRQILVNLLSNAVKFTEPGGTVAVTCAAAGTHAPDEGPWVRVRVEDTGIGIPPDQLESIFEPFVQVDTERTRVAGGTGLGLSISRRLARLMGGDLSVESEPGRGSTFTLTLPRAAGTG